MQKSESMSLDFEFPKRITENDMRLRKNSRGFVILVIAALITVATKNPMIHSKFDSLLSDQPDLFAAKSANVELHGPYGIVRVVDGDTVVVDIDGANTKVRLLGIDTPESVHPNKKRNTQEGKQASDWAKKLLAGKNVYLEYDVGKTDRYGRTLAYVYLDDQKTMVNRLLLQNGLAQIMTIQPNSRYANEFHRLQVAARQEGKGFWKTGFFQAMK